MLKKIKIPLAVCLLFISPVFSQNIKIAVAANLQSVIKVLARDFKQRTGIEIEPIVGSSGNLVAQMKNGAPFDVFLSADMTFPEALYKDGLSTREPVVYARGLLIICSNQDVGFENWEHLLLTDRIKKIAIANPKTAPYGKAAEETLKDKGILDDINGKIVTGESISQVNTYITTGAADAGFTTQALVKDPALKIKLYWKLIDQKTYSPIEQGMVLLKRSANNKNAVKFYRYMMTAPVKKILENYGYKI